MNVSEKKLKIAFVRTDYDPYGGAERFTNQLMEDLAKEGVECHIFARRWKGGKSGCHFHKVFAFSSPSVLRQASFVYFLKGQLSCQKFDIVQSNERTLSQTVYRAGDGVHARWLELRKESSPWWKHLWLDMSPFHRYMVWLERKLFESPELRAIIVNSEMVRKEITDRFQVDNTHIHTIYNGVDVEAYHPRHRLTVGAQLRRDLQVEPREPIALFVGSGYPRKGVPQLIEAMARVSKPGALWVVGKDTLGPYQRMAEDLGVGHKIKFFGKQKNVQPFYAAADFFVLPTLYDPFPSVALEAMASGLPIIVTRQCGAAEVITHGKEGFILERQDDESLAGYMEYLFSGGSARECMSHHAVNRANHFTSTNVYMKFLNLYWKILSDLRINQRFPDMAESQ